MSGVANSHEEAAARAPTAGDADEKMLRSRSPKRMAPDPDPEREITPVWALNLGAKIDGFIDKFSSRLESVEQETKKSSTKIGEIDS